MENSVQLMQRCLARLEETMTLQERIKVLRVLASTAGFLADRLETQQEIETV
jgi:hypothetical protein